MNTNTTQAIRLFSAYTAGRFYVWGLAGSAKASCRAHIMSAILGRKATQRESGINALRDALVGALGIDRAGHCSASLDDAIETAARQIGGAS